MVKAIEALKAGQAPLSEEFAELLREQRQRRSSGGWWGRVDGKQWRLNERFLSVIVGRPERLQRPE